MLGWPGSDWNDAPKATPPMDAAWQTLNVEALHTFTHFHLRLNIEIAHVPAEAEAKNGVFMTLDPSALPTVMRKVYDLAVGAFGTD